MCRFIKRLVDTRHLDIEWTKTIKIAGINMHGFSVFDLGKFKGTAVAEPDNPYDPNAVAIIRDDRKKLGYIPQHRAEKIAAKLAKFGGSVPCVGHVGMEKEYNSQRRFLMGYVQLLWK